MIKLNFSDKNMLKCITFLRNEFWGNIYQGSAHQGFTGFEGVMNLFFDKCFRAQNFILTYKNRHA